MALVKMERQRGVTFDIEHQNGTVDLTLLSNLTLPDKTNIYKAAVSVAGAASPKIHQLATRVFDAIEAGVLVTDSSSKYKPSTIRTYRLHYWNVIEPAFGSLKIDRLNRRQIQELVDRLAMSLAASTVNNMLMPLRLVVRFALRRDLIDANPFNAVQVPAKDEQPTRILSITEANTLVKTLAGRDRAVFATALFAGLRLGELRALRWKHIDFDRKVIRIEKSWDREEGEIRPKSRAGERAIPLVRELRQILIGLGPADDETFVLGSETRPFGPQSLYKRIDKVLSSVRLSGTRLRPCRHFFASMLIASGATVKEVQVYMGHSSVEITLNRYGHLFSGDEARAAERFSAHLSAQNFLITPDPSAITS